MNCENHEFRSYGAEAIEANMADLIRMEKQGLLELTDKKWCLNHQEINGVDSEAGNMAENLQEDVLQSSTVCPRITEFVG